MSDFDDLVEKLGPNKKKITKKDLSDFVVSSLKEISEINNLYKKYFESEEGEASYIEDIESKLERIKNEYSDLFEGDNSEESKIENLNTKIEEIKNYHKELLEGEQSIKADVEDSQNKINEFYDFLFSNTENGEAAEAKIRSAIKEIVDFNEKLSSEGGLIEATEEAHKKIMEEYESLYSPDTEGNIKISRLNEDISNIKNFNDKVESEIAPFLDETKKDIKSKSQDISALLSKAAVGSLVEDFLKSKKEYKQEPAYKNLGRSISKKTNAAIYNTGLWIGSTLSRFADYFLFIGPLVISAYIFIQPDLVASILGVDQSKVSVSDYINGMNFWGRLAVSLPLWWISWFGQRNISHKRKLAEEYNHKAQVTTMYLKFTSNTAGSYPLSPAAKNKLNEVLIDVIKRNPVEVYGKDETMLDKIIQIVLATKGIKKDDNITEEKKPS